MGTVFYGMSGEGHGHATRARTIAEALRGRHRVVLFAPDLAYNLLEPVYRGSDVTVEKIPGLAFAYGRAGRVSSLRTLGLAARYRLQVGGWIDSVSRVFDREKPDVVVADFEPILPRAARRLGVPFVSLDHQHYLVVSDLSGLPGGLRRRAALIAPFVRALYDWQDETVVSSFFAPPLKPRYRRAVQVGVFIRPELRRRRPEHGRYLLVYVRRFAPPALLDALQACGLEVRVYGLGARAASGRLSFYAFDEQRFMDDLAGCRAVVSTAGNQLVGEAFYLQKPVLALPESGNFEQQINAHFLRASGGGWDETGTMDSAKLTAFVAAIDELRSRIVPGAACGNEPALRVLERYLDAAPARAPLVAPAAVVRGTEPAPAWELAS